MYGSLAARSRRRSRQRGATPVCVEDMPALQEADAVVLPSNREGLPRALIEAGATGVPLVTTDVPSCREVVCDGVDGLITPVRNVEALALRRSLAPPRPSQRQFPKPSRRAIVSLRNT